MLCEFCKKLKATVHYTEIINNQMTKVNLCENCAKEKGIDVYPKFDMSDLLAKLTHVEGAPSVIEERSCARCGMTYQKFREIGRFGCSDCYTAFEEMLKPLLEMIHKANRHVGKVPKRWSKKGVVDVNLKALEDELQKAIAHEAYEEAARIRDRMKEIKEKAKRSK